MADQLTGGVAVIGVGNELRGDDGAGLVVARRVRQLTGQEGIEVRELGDEPAALLDAWLGRDAVIVTDTMRSGSAPGTIVRLDAARELLPLPRSGRSSTHAVGLQETVELARVLGRLPPRLVVYAVEGVRFNPGAGLSAKVRAAIPELVGMVVGEARQLADGPPE
ncbi:MAG: hydrogenase maturation protease [Solirubrobacteraceae bacterium]